MATYRSRVCVRQCVCVCVERSHRLHSETLLPWPCWEKQTHTGSIRNRLRKNLKRSEYLENIFIFPEWTLITLKAFIWVYKHNVLHVLLISCISHMVKIIFELNHIRYTHEVHILQVNLHTYLYIYIIQYSIILYNIIKKGFPDISSVNMRLLQFQIIK